MTSIALFLSLLQFASLEMVTLWGKIQTYFHQIFKQMSTVGFVLFYVGLILRFTMTRDEVDFTAAR